MPPCPPAETFLYAARHALRWTHLGASLLLFALATAHVLLVRRYFRGDHARAPLERGVAKGVGAVYALTFALGALLYPTYRVHVRAYYLDHHAPLVANLFDVKEAFAALTLVVAIGLGLLSFSFRPERDGYLLRVYAAMSLLVAAVVWFDAAAGVLTTWFRAV